MGKKIVCLGRIRQNIKKAGKKEKEEPFNNGMPKASDVYMNSLKK